MFWEQSHFTYLEHKFCAKVNILVFNTVSTLCPSSPYAIILSKSGKNAVVGRWFCCMLLWMHWPFCCIICLPVFGHWAISEKCFNCFHKWQWHVVTASKLLIASDCIKCSTFKNMCELVNMFLFYFLVQCFPLWNDV